MPRAEAGRCAVHVDMGTTNTRAWLVVDGTVVARASAAVGVRDTAREGSPARVRSVLREVIADVCADGAARGAPVPSYVAAAGMITSPLGLAEVPHVPAPAGHAELAAGVERHRFPDVTGLDVLLVPGVRSGPPRVGMTGIGEADLMRGEETLCIGLLERGWLAPGGTLLNLGSHWKVVRIGADRRIDSSLTSMAGELVHAAQTQTILASAVPHGRPAAIDDAWFRGGMEEQRRSGLARALFCVRLLEQRSESTPDERLAFLVGAFVAADLDALLARGAFTPGVPVAISGGGQVAAAFAQALAERNVPASLLTEEQVEGGLLVGLRCVVTGEPAA